MLLLCCGLLHGCFIVPVPRSTGPTSSSRIEVSAALPEQIVAGRTTRTEVLLLLGEPDGRGDLDRWFTYGSRVLRGGVGWAMYAGGGVETLGKSERVRRVTVRFDDNGVVLNIDVKEKNCTSDEENCIDPGGRELKTTDEKALAEHMLLTQLAAAGDGAVVAVYREAYWYPRVTRKRFFPGQPVKYPAAVAITATSVGFKMSHLEPGGAEKAGESDWLRIPFSDVVSVGVTGASSSWFAGPCAVTIAQTNGRVDWFSIPSDSDPELMDLPRIQAAAETLRSTLQAARH